MVVVTLSVSDNALVSIVMPSYQQDKFIEDSVLSVLAQSYKNLELVVQDGKSEDGTVSILSRIANSDSRIRWKSEADTGPASAINRAFAQAKGEIVGWLNSDDLYTPDAVSIVIEAFRSNPHWIMCYGNGQYIDERGTFVRPYPTKRPELGIKGFESGCFICQPTVFFKTSMLTLLGYLDETLETSFDFEYWLRAFTNFPDRIGFVDNVIAKSRLHSECITERMRETVALEGLELCKKYLDGTHSHWAVTYLEELRRECTNARIFEQKASSFLDSASKSLELALINELKSSLGLSRP